jgi:hypothetical protein
MLARIREAGFFRCTQPLEAVRRGADRIPFPCCSTSPVLCWGHRTRINIHPPSSVQCTATREDPHPPSLGVMHVGLSTWRMRHTSSCLSSLEAAAYTPCVRLRSTPRHAMSPHHRLLISVFPTPYPPLGLRSPTPVRASLYQSSSSCSTSPSARFCATKVSGPAM